MGTDGVAMHLIGFAIGFLNIGLVLDGVVDIGSVLSVLTPFADLMYGPRLVVVVAVASVP